MAEHNFVFSHETEQDHIFACSKCGEYIGFNKPGVGLPNADLSGPEPSPPTNVDVFVTPCPVEDA